MNVIDIYLIIMASIMLIISFIEKFITGNQLNAIWYLAMAILLSNQVKGEDK